ncbi:MULTISPECIES: hypothetical protein [Pseudomonas]|uniref:hypothetical protein n=1 Tax=Pseudomonas TaxID=286 RepID=UPI00215BD9E9|nr:MULTISPECIES: hypothetical protein [unclassified Pseudomonas]MCR8935114.1 hypothetical protein [Pseudomonas sp. S11A4]MCR8973376.1 hypothetical protein [Pseudomonas sp. S11P7]
MIEHLKKQRRHGSRKLRNHSPIAFVPALLIKSTTNFLPLWLEVEQNALISSEPRQSAVPASWNIATFLTTVSG